MKDSYTTILQRINSTPAEELKNLSRNLYQELLEHIGERYRIEFKSDDGVLEKGGQGVVIKCTDQFSKDKVVVKFALPDLLKHDGFWRRRELKKKFAKFTQHIKMNSPFVADMETEYSARFITGCLIQKQLYEIIFKEGLAEYGYVPKIIEMGKTPKLWVSMEYLPYESLLSWCRQRTNEEVLYLFYRMILFLENVVHQYGIAHCDLKPNNWMVANKLPVLFDFILAKNLNAKNGITDEYSLGHGSEYSTTRQKRSFVHRDFRDDLFTLALTFWAMWNRIDPIVIDEDVPIHSIFPPEGVPDFIRQIFIRATTEDANMYNQIGDLRRDVEKVLEWLLKTNTPISQPVKAKWDWDFINEECSRLPFGESVKQILKALERL